jgi:ABC-type multidrug transport system fused ATPase/permease subunit
MISSGKPGFAELRAARRQGRVLIFWTFVFSVFFNLLMLTGPLYMLQVYDRVLASRSVETLVALSMLVAMLYGLMAVLDFARGRVMARVGAQFQSTLDPRVFEATLRRGADPRDQAAGAAARPRGGRSGAPHACQGWWRRQLAECQGGSLLSLACVGPTCRPACLPGPPLPQSRAAGWCFAAA